MPVVSVKVNEQDLPLIQRAIGRALRTIRGTGVAEVIDGPNGVEVHVDPVKLAGSKYGDLLLVIVNDFKDDYLECSIYNPATGETEEETLAVAKPYLLRRTPFDGLSVSYPNAQTIAYTYTSQRERSADDGSDSETQVMTPDYYVGEQLLVVRVATGLEDDNEKEIEWVDVNTAGRFWATEPS